MYNEDCAEMVARLKKMCHDIDGLQYEILIGDDCSTDKAIAEANREVGLWSHCRLIERKENGGAGATRNHLVRESRYNRLLFLDCDMEIPKPDFISLYLDNASEGTVVNGGIEIAEPRHDKKTHNLRYLYESKAAPMHTAEQRAKSPYKSFRSTNFLAPRKVMLEHPFFEPMRRYEDVYFGKTLKESGVRIRHIDNPLILVNFDSNESYIRKVEKDMATLARYSRELRGYSPMLTAYTTVTHWLPACLIRLWHTIFGRLIRSNLTGSHPILKLLNIYKMGYFACQKNLLTNKE